MTPSNKPIAKVVLTHPRSGREIKIDATIYNAIKAAILKSLKGSKGKTFTELADDVVATIHKKIPAFKGSVPWYTISVLRHLETTAIVEPIALKGKKVNRLKR